MGFESPFQLSARTDPHPKATMPWEILGLNRNALRRVLAENGLSASHANSLYRWIYKDLHDVPAQCPELPRLLPQGLVRSSAQPLPHARLVESPADGSVKFLFRLSDGQDVESVLIPESRRVTLCVSSQVGCQRGCVFCHTGRMGLRRDLLTSEIVNQLVSASKWIKHNPDWLERVALPVGTRISNVVFMGMGEPMDNLDAVMAAIEIFCDPYGLLLSQRRISVSTSGHIPGIQRLAATLPGVSLAVSLHGTKDSLRSRIMPINRQYPLGELVKALRGLQLGPKRFVMIQYTLMRGINDSEGDAARLVALLDGIPVKVNLIPYNDVGPVRMEEPDPSTTQKFQDYLHRAGLRVMVRYSKGRDIAGACGQLVTAEA